MTRMTIAQLQADLEELAEKYGSHQEMRFQDADGNWRPLHFEEVGITRDRNAPHSE